MLTNRLHEPARLVGNRTAFGDRDGVAFQVYIDADGTLHEIILRRSQIARAGRSVACMSDTVLMLMKRCCAVVGWRVPVLSCNKTSVHKLIDAEGLRL